VIKRIRFATRKHDVPPEAFATAWPLAVAVVAEAPADARPSRIAVCTTLPELFPDPKHDGIAFECFADDRHLARFESWLETGDGQSSLRAFDEVVDRSASPVVVAEECVVRGADWLEQRWRDGGAKLKHMAIALRSADLSAAEFSDRWRNHAGQLGRSGSAVVIPDDARGLAYVQDHPLPRPTGDWAYDALNEVWFEDLENLQTRIEWFRENLLDQGDDDLVRQSWFIAAREDVVLA
jgi:hypothetical protein